MTTARSAETDQRSDGPAIRRQNGDIPAMTGIRGAAAIWVVTYHFSPVIYQLLPGVRLGDLVIHAGLLSVDIFFVLSGFILSYNYAERLAAPDRRGLARFFTARFARIYPVYVVALLLTLGLVAAAAANGRTWDPGREFTFAGFVGNLLMLQAFPGVPLWNIPSWSVACEVFAYLVFPFVAGLLLRMSGRVSVAAAVVILAAAVTVLVAVDAPYVTVQGWVRVTAGFAVGCLLWRVWHESARPHRRWDAVALLCVGGTLVVALTGADPYLALPLVALFVLSVAGATGVVATMLGSRAMQWGGRLSYSIYLLQIPVFHVMLMAHSPRSFVDAPLPVRVSLVVSYYVVLVLAAMLAHRFVEEPVRRWILRRGTSASSVPVTGPVRPR